MPSNFCIARHPTLKNTSDIVITVSTSSATSPSFATKQHSLHALCPLLIYIFLPLNVVYVQLEIKNIYEKIKNILWTTTSYIKTPYHDARYHQGLQSTNSRERID